MGDLNAIVELSYEFKSVDCVKVRRGSASVKNNTSLWIKPFDTTLTELNPETFVQMKRARIKELYATETLSEPTTCKDQVKNLMAATVENDAGCPSIEVHLHDVLQAKYVVHTHPALVNGLTHAKEGEATCRRLFPDALWVEYIEPGYPLCMDVRNCIAKYTAEYGQEPTLLFFQNYGMFIAADTPNGIRSLYGRVMDTLSDEYAKAEVAEVFDIADEPDDPEMEKKIKEIFGDDAAFIASSGIFAYAPWPISPDHLIYFSAFPFSRPLTAEGAESYKRERGYAPKVVVAGDRVYGIGNSQKNADRALELAQHGALVMQLTTAFGGVNYMTEAQCEFLENWEEKSYRARQVK